MHFVRMYRVFSYLSLDVVAGAMAGAWAIAALAHGSLSGCTLAVIGLVVWIIYTADHLLDVSGGLVAHSSRRRFHARYRSLLFSLLLSALVCCALLIFQLDRQVLLSGAGLAALLLIYLLWRNKHGWIKEGMVVAGYTAGISLPVWAQPELMLPSWFWWALVQYALVVWLNVWLMAWMDREEDATEGHQSWAQVGSSFLVRRWMLLPLACQLPAIIISILQGVPPGWVLMCTIMALWMFVVSRIPQRHCATETARWLIEIIFVFPVLGSLFL